jgi:hypothetical protein
MHILVPWGKVVLNISSFFLAVIDGYGAEGGRDFEAKVCWMQGGHEGVQLASPKYGIVGL